MSDLDAIDSRDASVGQSMKTFPTYLLGILVGASIATILCLFPWIVPVPKHHDYPLIPTGVTTVPAYPREMIIRFVSNKEFYNSSLSASVARANGIGSTGKLAAYTMINESPCTIVIPLPVQFYVSPKSGKAMFDDPEDSDTIAHEILHCLYGSWHPKWDTIFKSK